MPFLKCGFPLLIILLISCHRSNVDAELIEFVESTGTRIIVDSNAIDSTALFFLRSGSFTGAFTEGSGYVEPGLTKKYFISVVVKVGEGAQAMLMGWESDDLAAGSYEGEILTILVSENPDVYLSSGTFSGGRFTVEMGEVGAVGSILSGTFRGTARKTGQSDLVSFDGLFNVERKE